LFEGAFFALIQLLIPTGLSKELIKRGLQNTGLIRGGMGTVVQKALVELPESGAELLQEGEMVSEAWLEFLVMTKFMNPAQGQFDRESVELGRVIAEQECNHRVVRLGSIGCNG